MKRRFVRELKTEHREPVHQHSSSDWEEESGEEGEQPPARRGRQAIPVSWTRVHRVSYDLPPEVKIYSIETELKRSTVQKDTHRRLTEA